MSERIKALVDYLRSGAVICPYAKTAELTMLAEQEIGVSAHRWFFEVVHGDGNAGVIVASDACDSDHEAREWCRHALYRLRGELGANIDAAPFVDIHDKVLFVFGMGPQYEARHPRYAPHLCLVAVNEADVRSVPLRIREAILMEMGARVGGVYDANHVWLAKEPPLKRRA